MNAALCPHSQQQASGVAIGSTLAHFGIDNGFSGAIAILDAENQIEVSPVIYQDLGREKLLDVDRNLKMIRDLLATAHVAPERALVVFEQSQINPKFGARNNYQNGRNNEFWRVVLTSARIPYAWVNPRSWQKRVFEGVRGNDTKEMAALAVRRRFPNLDLSGYTKAQREGICDAICIALWGRLTNQ